ncbi:MAG: hypothetical protein Q8O95_00905 [bacterium]|nr:hypothetical protein [bacterium]
MFTIHDLKVLFADSSYEYLLLKLSRWKKKGLLISLKRGVYVFPEITLDEFEISSLLLKPSYISLESALSHYSLIPEVSAEVTAVTSKNTHHYRIGKTRYHFHHVRQELFTGFRSLDDEVFIAVPEKALLDYCYLRHPGSDDMIFERFNREKAVTLDISLLKQMAALYPPYVQHFVIHLLDVIT